ncbi:cytochrome P450 71A9-like [Oryza brachyantha]|uniref:cytochrome P450 71A9-like n=1 Tax=Oryza brachyantha TaxID=4533 RepID=UPI001AD9C3F6|nr:cytochrome P450 71A9-like [Oryza brachyantha]
MAAVSMASLQLQAPEFLASCLLLLLATILLFRQLLAPSSKPSLPRPRGLPLIGNLHQIGTLPHRSLAALAARHAAPLMLLRLGSVPTLVVSTADAARELFRDNDRALSGRPDLYAATKLSYGHKSISFAPDGAYWRAARRACLSELLGAPRVRAFRDAREREAAALVAAVARASDAGSPVNLSDMVAATSNGIVRRVAFGDHESLDAKALIDETQALLCDFFVGDYVPWLRWLDALRGIRRRLERRFQQLDALYERVIDDHLNRSKGASEEEDDLVDVLLRLHGDPAHRSTFSSRSHIKGILTDIFIAGSDTSAVTVQWAMTELLRNPAVLAKAQREVRSVVGGGRGMVREADLPELHYLRLVIREAMRLHPAAPLLVPRETTEPCTVHGVEVPAKTRVLINATAIHTDPGVWGPDAERFVPERHRGGGGEHRTPWHDGFALVPFGVGRRSCPGVHFATAVVELLLANLLFCFDWRPPPGHDVVDVEEENGLAVRKKNPLVLLAKRNTS